MSGGKSKKMTFQMPGQHFQMPSHNPKTQQWYHTLGLEMGQDSEAFLASATPTPMSQSSRHLRLMREVV